MHLVSRSATSTVTRFQASHQRSASQVARVAKPPIRDDSIEIPPMHGPAATESWAEEVCEIKPEAGNGKVAAIKCAQALDAVAEEEHKHPKQAPERVQGRCMSPSDDECTGP